MSEKELNRFLIDLESDHALRGAAEALVPSDADGFTVPTESLLGFAQSRGYNVVLADITAQAGELDENELEQITGGAGLTGAVNTHAMEDRPWIDINSFTPSRVPGGGGIDTSRTVTKK